MNRPDWDTYFLNIADVVATRGTCPKRQVGCVLVNADHQIIGTGYNGAPRGMAHCLEVGCQEVGGRCGRAVHAEHNALDYATRADKRGATCYITAHPCYKCAQELIQAGVVRVVYRDNEQPYRDPQATTLLTEAGIDVVEILGLPDPVLKQSPALSAENWAYLERLQKHAE